MVFQAPEPKSITEGQKTDIITASGTTSNGASIIVARDDNCDILLYSLTVNGGSATIESTSHIPIDSNPLVKKIIASEIYVFHITERYAGSR